MYRFYINKITNDYHFAELCRVFLDNNEFETMPIDIEDADEICFTDNSYLINSERSDDHNRIKRELYDLLVSITGRGSKWGTMTGVRPLNLAFTEYERCGNIDMAMDALRSKYLISDNKCDLLREILTYQLDNIEAPAQGSASVYIGIPFCPTRCVYCAFASYVAEEQDIEEYLEKLLIEIKTTGEAAKKRNIPVESVYIGGGTPTTLSTPQLKRLITTTTDAFSIEAGNIEFTVEAGRPDTIDRDKLETIRNSGARRISINPQSMSDRTLEAIGRAHTGEDIRKAFHTAEDIDFDTINADIIAGLPGEGLDDFTRSVRDVIELGANNITIHTLSVKHGSKLMEKSPDLYRRGSAEVAEMLDMAHNMLREAGFYPYYIYRQKHQLGALENVGYCRDGKHSLYNIRIMEEKQTVIGLGAGAIGKIYYPDENRLERVPNVSNYKVYCDRFDTMLERKNKYFGGKQWQ